MITKIENREMYPSCLLLIHFCLYSKCTTLLWNLGDLISCSYHYGPEVLQAFPSSSSCCQSYAIGQPSRHKSDYCTHRYRLDLDAYTTLICSTGDQSIMTSMDIMALINFVN